VPQSVWVKTGALQWWCDWKPHKWVDVRVALEQFTGHDGARDSVLFMYYVVHEEKKVPRSREAREGGPSRTLSWRGDTGKAPKVLFSESVSSS
jgi:hypothetical protein